MTPEEMARIVADPHLTNEAVRLILFVASHGDGEHEIEADELRVILGCKGDGPVYKARERATNRNYLAWRQGGKGHANVYRYLAPITEVNALPHSQDGGKALVVVERKIEVVPPSPPLSFPLSVKAMQAISDATEKLAGCRGALVDYLQARVPEARQYGYVQSVITWLDNPKQVFQMADGMPVPPEERVKLLAVALNEMAASDESGYAAPSGDVRNVKNKLFSLSRGFGKKATGTHGARASPRDKPSDTQVYTPTETFLGFNG